MTRVILLDNPVLKYRPNSSVPVNIKAVADRIAVHLGDEGRGFGRPYFVPFAAVHADLAGEQGITGDGDLYGGIVRHHEHADKAILHVLASSGSQHAQWYSPSLAESVQDVVLPGYTAFSQADAEQAFDLMRSRGLTVRVKDPANTGGLGQHLAQDVVELRKVLTAYADKMERTGVVLEADLHGHTTVTIGYVNLGGVIYTWYGRPYDVEHEGMMRFGGNELTVVRGGLETLHSYCDDLSGQLAVKQAKRVFEAYDLLGATIGRATLDAVQGTACDGTFLSGITDPSLRPSASSAAEIRAIEALSENPDALMARTRLVYDYKKEIMRGPEQELFVGHSRMNILVELAQVA